VFENFKWASWKYFITLQCLKVSSFSQLPALADRTGPRLYCILHPLASILLSGSIRLNLSVARVGSARFDVRNLYGFGSDS